MLLTRLNYSMKLLKTNNMILFIVSFFAFILVGYELNHAQVVNNQSELNPVSIPIIEDSQINERNDININYLIPINIENNS